MVGSDTVVTVQQSAVGLTLTCSCAASADSLCDAQAQVLLRQGHTYLDGNGDGEACESLRL